MKKLQLQIPLPCHENWDKMTLLEKGRFCGSCQKQVVDFSSMNDRDIAMFFKKPSTGSVCGRFMQDQLDRDIEIPRKRIPWVKYFFQFLLPGFLISMKAKAQGEVRIIGKDSKVVSKCLVQKKKNDARDTTILPGVVVTSISCKPVKGKISMGYTTTQVKPGTTGIKGKILDDNFNPIPYATVMIKGTKNGVISDSNGLFFIKPGEGWENVTLFVSVVGFESREVEVFQKSYANDINIELTLQKVFLGGLVITKCYPKKKSIPLLRSLFKDIPFSKFKVYPNPVKSSSALNIEWKQTEEGYYILQLFNQSGQVVFVKEMYIDKEARLLSVDLPSTPAGSYFLRMTNKASNKSYTEKIIVQ